MMFVKPVWSAPHFLQECFWRFQIVTLAILVLRQGPQSGHRQPRLQSASQATPEAKEGFGLVAPLLLESDLG